MRMTKSLYDKWGELHDKASNSTNLIIVESYLKKGCKTKLYFGESQTIQCIYVEFVQGFLKDVEMPDLKGINISIVKEPAIDASKEYVKIVNNSNKYELFVALSSSLRDEFVELTTYEDVFASINKTLKEYRDVFSNNDVSLSLKEEQGLYAEMLEIKELILRKGEDIITCWQGPYKNKRDFVFGTTALEIKSTSVQVDSNIHISNENQLDSSYPDTLSKLFLKVYILEQDANGVDILSCAKEIMDMLSTAKNKMAFIAKLLEIKVDLNSYVPKYKFTLQTTKQYVVDESFPCITSSTIPIGVYDVEYKLKLNTLSHFEIASEKMYEQL